MGVHPMVTDDGSCVCVCVLWRVEASVAGPWITVPMYQRPPLAKETDRAPMGWGGRNRIWQAGCATLLPHWWLPQEQVKYVLFE